MSISPTFAGNLVTVGGRTWAVPYPIRDARRIGGRIVVIYDYLAGPRHATFRNVEAFDDAGAKLWTAEHPSRCDPADAYVEFMSEVPLVVWNFACFRCTLDPATGKLLRADFTK
jgi:hypothetical protein